MRLPRTLVLAAVAGGLSACATGKKVEAETYRQIQENRTTKSELIELLGPPTSTGFQGNDEILTYSSSKTDAATFIPFAGVFLGGNEIQVCSFHFNASQVLTYKSCTGAAAGNRVLSN